MTDQRLAALRARNEQANAERRRKVLAAAMTEAQDVGFQWITRAAVASRAGMSDANVSFAFGGMIELKRAVLREAIRTENIPIIAQALGERHPIIMEEAPETLRESAARYMVAS